LNQIETVSKVNQGKTIFRQTLGKWPYDKLDFDDFAL